MMSTEPGILKVELRRAGSAGSLNPRCLQPAARTHRRTQSGSLRSPPGATGFPVPLRRPLLCGGSAEAAERHALNPSSFTANK